MTPEEKVVDLLAEGIGTLPALKAAMEADGVDAKDLETILGDLTEQDFAEVTNLHGKIVKREGDRILDFAGLTLALTPPASSAGCWKKPSGTGSKKKDVGCSFLSCSGTRKKGTERKKKRRPAQYLCRGWAGVMLSPQGEHHLPSGKLHCETTSLAARRTSPIYGETVFFLFTRKK